MSLKKALVPSLLLCGLANYGVAAPAIALGDDAALFVTGAFELESNTNIFRDLVGEESDVQYSFIPGVELRFGTPGALTGSATASYKIVAFDVADDLDGEFVNLGLRTSYVSGPLSTSFNASFVESFSTDEDTANVQSLLELSNATLTASARYQFSEALGGSLTLEGKETDYDSDALADTESISIGGRAFFALTGRTHLTAGIRFRDSEITLADGSEVSYEDTAFSVGISGELFSPLWTGDLQVGWQDREFDTAGSDDTVFYAGSVRFVPNSRQSYTLRVSRDYSASASNGGSFARGNGVLSANYVLTPQLSLNGSISYTETSYAESIRDNNNVTASAGVTYRPNEYLNLSLTARSVNVEADGANGTAYDQAVIAVRAAFRY